MHPGRSIEKIATFIREEIAAGRTAKISEEELADAVGAPSDRYSEGVQSAVQHLQKLCGIQARETGGNFVFKVPRDLAAQPAPALDATRQ